MLRLHSLRLQPTHTCAQPISQTARCFEFSKLNNHKNTSFLPLQRSINTTIHTWRFSLRPQYFSNISMKYEHVILQKHPNIFIQKNLSHDQTNDEKSSRNKRKKQRDPMDSPSELVKWLMEGNRWMYVALGPTIYVLVMLLLLHLFLEDKKQERREIMAFRMEMEKNGPPDYKKRVQDEDFYQKVIIAFGAVSAFLVVPLTIHLRHRKNMMKASYVKETLALTRETLLYLGIPNAVAAPFIYAVNKKYKSQDYLSMWNGFWAGAFAALATHVIAVPYWMLCIPEREIKSKTLSAWLNQTSIVIKQFLNANRRPPRMVYLGGTAFLLVIFGPFTIPFNAFMFSMLSLAFQKTYLIPWKAQLKIRKEEEKSKLTTQQEASKPKVEPPVIPPSPEKPQQHQIDITVEKIPQDQNKKPDEPQKDERVPQTSTQSVAERRESSRIPSVATGSSQGAQTENQTHVVDINTTRPHK